MSECENAERALEYWESQARARYGITGTPEITRDGVFIRLMWEAPPPVLRARTGFSFTSEQAAGQFADSVAQRGWRM